jgi:hypothetical protein
VILLLSALFSSFLRLSASIRYFSTMGNCCASESKQQSQHEERIKKEQEREEAKRQLEEGLRNMANGQ